MAHLTSSPFHKPSPFEFPQRTSTTDTLPSNHQLPTPASISVLGGQDPHAAEYFDTPAASVSAELSGSRFRRVASSIMYHNSGLRDSRERPVQRSSRSFLVVMPPSSLPQDHGHLGHTLSSGPRHRLSQGLLMPLFPTMYGQLTAIAREFNFPSTTGICLYLHINENGITATPRIADDSWQMIWSQALDPNSPGPAHHSLPICGKIEFDIDMRMARWYGAWVALSHREQVDVPMSVTPSAAPSIIHYREESRTTFADGDDQDTASVARPPARHVPRKLSLVDRFDTMSARSVPRSQIARPPAPEPLPSSQNLSPIFQEEEPKTAKFDLEHRVNSWRASAQIHPDAAGHILLAGAHLPDSPLDESPIPVTASNDDENNEDEYHIEDFAFSISSAGPGDYDPYSPLTWYYDPSIHVAHRAQGSVCMTPTECTSFGPSDYTLSLYAPNFDVDVLRTPDIAHRMLEDVPPSPSVATTWGAPLSYPASPISDYHAPSVHLGDRQCFSRPVTPMTATSWGAPESFPPSPTTPFYVRTPDAGQRAFDLSCFTDDDTPWNLVWPYHDAGRPWNHVWPYHSGEVREQEQDNTAAEPWNMVWPYHSAHVPRQTASRSSAPWNMVWPYHVGDVLEQQHRPWNMVWPYHASSTASSGPVSVSLPAAYPRLNIYSAEYPWNLNEIYPALAVDVAPRNLSTSSAGYPYNLDEIYPAVTTSSVPAETSAPLAAYPYFRIYAAVYPYNLDEIYPVVAGSWTGSAFARGPISVRLAAGPAIYPGYLDEIYPAAVRAEAEDMGITIRLPSRYPSFNLYAAVYPYNLDEIYPAVTVGGSAPDASTGLSAYPYLSIYSSVYPYNLEEIYPVVFGSRTSTANGSLARGPISVRLAPGPATYPGCLDEIYPARIAPRTPNRHKTGVFGLSVIYPHFDLYPAVSAQRTIPVHSRTPISVSLPARYPAFNLYPNVYPYLQPYPPVGYEMETAEFNVVYPHFDLYPAVKTQRKVAVSGRGPVSVSLSTFYPTFNLYPAVQYPYNLDEIYPATTLEDTHLEISTHLSAYPCLRIYAAVYPYNLDEIYPAVTVDAAPVKIAAPSVVYPHFDLYPAVNSQRGVALPTRSPILMLLPASYPCFNLYPAVEYPYNLNEIYPVISVDEATQGVSTRLAAYPYLIIYAAVYPYNLDMIYPAVAVDSLENSSGGLSTMEAPRPRRQSRFTSSDLHALMQKASLEPQRGMRKTHEALHLAVFPRGSEVLTPSGTPRHNVIQTPRKSHLDLHTEIFPRGADVQTPSGTPAVLEVSAASPLPSRPTRLRSGSVLRNSLPPSPRPPNGRPVSVLRPPATTMPPPPAPTDALKRSVSMATRPSVAGRVGSTLTRSLSMASPPSSALPATPLERSTSVGGPRAAPLRKRDSLVLQRVRAFQQQEPIKEDDLANFPMPPPRPSVVRKVVS